MSLKGVSSTASTTSALSLFNSTMDGPEYMDYVRERRHGKESTTGGSERGKDFTIVSQWQNRIRVGVTESGVRRSSIQVRDSTSTEWL